MMVARYAINVIFLILLYTRESIPCSDKRILCIGQTTCDKCIQAHHCCSFCYDETFSSDIRCDTREELVSSGCANASIEDSGGPSRIEIIRDQTFTDYVEATSDEPVQIRPQQFKVYLRQDEPLDIKFRYQPAKDYPLDLYYLTDASYTMALDIDTLITLAEELARNMKTLTKNFRLGLGIFSEKNVVPFSYTLDQELHQHCDQAKVSTCTAGFDFSHKLDFTEEIQKFIDQAKKVRNETTINIDEPEAGLDALMQIMLCEQQLDWKTYSRKIIVMATDATMHMAGDGKISGAVKRNAKRCGLDNTGSYVKSLEYDYPSLEEIYKQLLKRKMNVIFAAKENVFEYYKQMNRLISDVTFTALLKDKSVNVIDLVREGYLNVIRNVRFSCNTTHAPELNVRFMGNCSKTRAFFNNYGSCDNIVDGRTYEFTARLTQLDISEENYHKQEETIFIEELNLKEKIQIDVQYIGKTCSCKNENRKRRTRQDVCGGNGQYRCGACVCNTGWTGASCETTCSDATEEACITNGTTLACHGWGDCVCGKCECDFGRSGDFCQYTCPIKNRKICAGHGTCIDNKCHCVREYSGEFCSCPVSEETCTAPGQEVCSGKGTCRCGVCDCWQNYYGDFCEKCPTCSGLCEAYQGCVVGNLTGKSREDSQCEMEQLLIEKTVFEDVPETCEVRFYKNDEYCEAEYKYKITKSGQVHVGIVNENCRIPRSAIMNVGIVLGVTIGLGLLGILLYKLNLMRQDRAEYQKFVAEKEKYKNTRSENPLYNSPITEYTNPLAGTRQQDYNESN